MFKIVKIKTKNEADLFAYDFLISSSHGIPGDYFLSGDTYCFYDEYGLIGGYSLIKHTQKRTLNQIPSDHHSQICIDDLRRRSLEITGYFIIKNRPAFLMVTHFMIKTFLSRSKYFIYSYDKTNKKLEKHYSHAKPFRLYSGVVKNLEGMTGINYENVEVITRMGFFRLWINRLIRKINLWK